MSGLADAICEKLWQRLEPRIEDLTHAVAHHIPIIDVDTDPGDTGHVLCYCTEGFGFVDDWAEHALIEVKRELRGDT